MGKGGDKAQPKVKTGTFIPRLSASYELAANENESSARTPDKKSDDCIGSKSPAEDNTPKSVDLTANGMTVLATIADRFARADTDDDETKNEGTARRSSETRQVCRK
jgi:hypothetical protein